MNIAFIGKKQVGKDTAAKVLIDKYGYKRISFADSLKYELHLMLTNDNNSSYDAVRWFDKRKNDPEIRQLMQAYGSVKRNHIHSDYWLHEVLARIQINGTQSPIVIPDCRYMNEVVKLKELGFKTVRILLNTIPNDTHISETELDSYECDYTIWNIGTIAELHKNVESIIGFPTEGAHYSVSYSEFVNEMTKKAGN